MRTLIALIADVSLFLTAGSLVVFGGAILALFLPLFLLALVGVLAGLNDHTVPDPQPIDQPSWVARWLLNSVGKASTVETSAQPAFQLDDQVSFVHLVETDHGAAPFAALLAYRRFRSTVEQRCEQEPTMSQAKEVGSYRDHRRGKQ
jgi:hypothetical protein